MPAFATPGPIAATVQVAGARVRIGEVEGPVRIASSGGRARIGHAAAGLQLSSGRGGFDVDRADGSVTATAGDGAIRIGRLTRGRAELTNGSGDIEVGISEGTAAYLDVNSERGSVRNSVASPESADASDTKVAVRARTRYGDIIIRRAAS
jgi:Putative adhesin